MPNLRPEDDGVHGSLRGVLEYDLGQLLETIVEAHDGGHYRWNVRVCMSVGVVV